MTHTHMRTKCACACALTADMHLSIVCCTVSRCETHETINRHHIENGTVTVRLYCLHFVFAVVVVIFAELKSQHLL